MAEPEFEYLGPYRVLGILGRGGMGTVYKGTHAKSGQVAAIKVIATAVANQARFRRRFEAEIKTLQKLKHPNIVELQGVGEEQGLLFYTMEYVDGLTLHDHLRRLSRLPWQDVVEVAIQTSAALKHAHDLGIIHRDLKPANLILSSKGMIKLTDFGIAKLFGSSDMTAVGSVIGTADYMPPEQAEGKSVTVKSDLYGLGTVMYALLCGKPPFTGKSVPEVLYAVRYNPVPRLDERVSDVPDELIELVHQLLEKSPSNRPPTALVVGNRLKSIQQAMKKLAKDTQRPEAEGGTPAGPKKVGTQLTSLDLSEVDDEEFRITNDGQDGSLIDTPISADEPMSGKPPTRENGTVIASQLSFEAGDDTPTELADSAEQRQAANANAGRDSGGRSRDGQPVDNAVAPSRDDSSMSGPEDDDIVAGGRSHYTPITEIGSRDSEFSFHTEEHTQGHWIRWVSIVGLAAILIASLGSVVWMLQPRSSDEIYQSIMEAVDSGDDQRLLLTKSDIDEFLARFPDDERVADIRSLDDELELTRWTRVLRRRSTRASGADPLSALEQAFLDCMVARETDPEAARQKLDAFIGLCAAKQGLARDEAWLLELAQFAARQSEQAIRVVSPAALELEAMIQRAEEEKDGQDLTEFYENILLIYGDKTWAADQVSRIQALLDEEQQP